MQPQTPPEPNPGTSKQVQPRTVGAKFAIGTSIDVALSVVALLISSAIGAKFDQTMLGLVIGAVVALFLRAVVQEFRIRMLDREQPSNAADE